MTSSEEFNNTVNETEAMKSLYRMLAEEPLKIFRVICREYEATEKPVPDHHINFTDYFTATILRALVSSKMLIRETGDKLSLYSYIPTEQGIHFYRRMSEEDSIRV